MNSKGVSKKPKVLRSLHGEDLEFLSMEVNKYSPLGGGATNLRELDLENGV